MSRAPASTGATAVRCPTCKAEPGQRCQGRSRAIVLGHQARRDRLAVQAARLAALAATEGEAGR